MCFQQNLNRFEFLNFEEASISNFTFYLSTVNNISSSGHVVDAKVVGICQIVNFCCKV